MGAAGQGDSETDWAIEQLQALNEATDRVAHLRFKADAKGDGRLTICAFLPLGKKAYRVIERGGAAATVGQAVLDLAVEVLSEALGRSA